MELDRLPEPDHLKEEVLDLFERHPETREEGDHSVAEPISFWYGNKLPRYLWNAGWGAPLRRAGLEPDAFMRAVGAHRKGFRKWIEGEIEWDRLLEFIRASTKKAVDQLNPKAEA